ncbi:MAG: tetratricopeptide repeat protein [candidate division FCPU426 bacterium]
MRKFRPLLLSVLAAGLALFCAATNAVSEPRPEERRAVEPDSIISTYQKAVAADPRDVIAAFNLGLAYYQAEHWTEARDALEKCLRTNTGDQGAHDQVDGSANQLLGIIYYSHLHDDRRAVEALRRSLKWLPNDPDVYFALGLANLRLKDNHAALQYFQEALAKGRERDPEVHYQIGRVYLEQGNDKEALASLNKALELKPDFQPALETLGLVYHRRQDETNAIQVLERLTKLDPANFNAYYLLGLNYYRKKMYSEMVAAYKRAVTIQPDLADAYYNLGMAYYYQTRYDLAIESLKKAVTLNPKDAEAFNLLGQAKSAAVDWCMQQSSLHIAQEEFPQAIEELRKVLAIDPNQHKAKVLLEDLERKVAEEVGAHLRLAGKFSQEGRLEDAYNEYEQAVKFDPTSEAAQTGLKKTRARLSNLLAQLLQKGRAEEKRGNYLEARKYYRSILENRQKDPEATKALKSLEDTVQLRLKRWWTEAKTHTEAGRLREAAAVYRQLGSLAESFGDDEWQEKAFAGLNQVNERQAQLVQNYLAEGKQAYEQKQFLAAQKAFNQVLALDPRQRTANEYVEKMTGSVSLEKVKSDKIKEMYYKGVDHYIKGEINEAIKAWQEVLALDPDNADAKINISRAQVKLQAIKKLTEGR